MQHHIVVSDSARQLASAHDTRCRIWGALIHTFVDLGESPLCERVLGAEQLHDVELFCPLHAVVCHRCFLVQLRDVESVSRILHEDASHSHAASWIEDARRYCHMIK
jgi:hypothetical protein